MSERQWLAACLLFCAVAGRVACAADLSSLSNADASRGLKQALNQGIDQAVAKLGFTDGFLGNPAVKIPLPPTLAKAGGMLRMLGMGRQTDALVVAMNRAAEQAVPEGKQILTQALHQMTLADAKAILSGSDDAATQYFRRVAYAPLQAKFLPIVSRAMQQVGSTERYDALAAKAAAVGMMQPDQASIESYVTRKTLDGLFLMMAQEERAIRQDPLGQASSLLRKVFGAAH